MQRYFAKDKIHENFILDESDIHHIKNVMRMNISDLIEVVYNGYVYVCSITELSDKIIELDVVSKKEENHELKTNIAIAFAISKEDKIDMILQKCTELGAYEFYPVAMNRCVVKIDENKKQNKLSRWRKICKEASEQSKRNIIPEVHDIVSVKDLCNLNYDLKIVCSINKNITNLNNIIHNNSNCKKIIVVIGPEGDFTNEEENLLIKNKYIPVSLGNTILRMETAPIFVCGCINYENME